MRSPNLQEECHGTVDIAGHRRQLAKVTEQQNNLVAGSENARYQWLVDKGTFRVHLLDKGIAVPAESHESVHSRLHSSLGHRKHDAPIVRRTFTRTGVKVASSVPSEGHVSCDLEQCDSQWQARRLSRQEGICEWFSTTRWGSIDISILTLLSHKSICGWFSATGQGLISIRFAIMLYHCIIPGDGEASMEEIVLEQRLDQSGNRLRRQGLRGARMPSAS